MWAPNQRSIFRSDALGGGEEDRRLSGPRNKSPTVPNPTPAYFITRYFYLSQEIPDTATFFICQVKETPALQCPFVLPILPKAHLLGPRAHSLAVSTASKLGFQNRNHFLPRQQQNSLEQWFYLSCISELPGELFKILMPRLYPQPIKSDSLLVGRYPHLLKLPS